MARNKKTEAGTVDMAAMFQQFIDSLPADVVTKVIADKVGKKSAAPKKEKLPPTFTRKADWTDKAGVTHAMFGFDMHVEDGKTDYMGNKTNKGLAHWKLVLDSVDSIRRVISQYEQSLKRKAS